MADEQPCCAHLRVVYIRQRDGEFFRDHWQCPDCGIPFAPTVIAERELERLRPRQNHEGSTHWEECWRTRGHHDCAVAELERMRAAFHPVRHWYDGDGRFTDLAEMLSAAIEDLQVDRKRAATAERRLAEAERLLRECADALIWCSGAEPFSQEGTARKGWDSVARPALDRTLVFLSQPESEDA